MAVGWPALTASTKFVNCSGASEEGWTASNTAYLPISIGLLASTSSTSYCFSSSVDDLLLGHLAGHAAGEREAAEQLGVGAHNPDLLAFALSHGADRTDQFVLDRHAVVEERYDHLFQSRAERRPQDDLLVAKRAACACANQRRFDAEPLFRDRGLVAERFQIIVQPHVDLAAATSR